MVLALITDAVLDITWGVAYWTIKKTGSGIYNLGKYILGYKEEGSEACEVETEEDKNSQILMEEIGKLREEIKDLKESIS